VAPLASFEVQVATERPAAIVAGRARAVADRKMLKRARRTYLPPLGESRRIVVAIRAAQPLPGAVLRMTKPHSIRW